MPSEAYRDMPPHRPSYIFDHTWLRRTVHNVNRSLAARGTHREGRRSKAGTWFPPRICAAPLDTVDRGLNIGFQAAMSALSGSSSLSAAVSRRPPLHSATPSTKNAPDASLDTGVRRNYLRHSGSFVSEEFPLIARHVQLSRVLLPRRRLVERV
ncbi:hypothetical protein MRX96_044171 [Rhipicephalus microplus]